MKNMNLNLVIFMWLIYEISELNLLQTGTKAGYSGIWYLTYAQFALTTRP